MASRSRRHLLILVAITLAVPTLLFAVGWVVLAPERAAADACKDKMELLLRSPGSAEWGDVAAYDAETDDEYEVHGHVDSENSFGASVRTTFSCTVRDGEVTSFSHLP